METKGEYSVAGKIKENKMEIMVLLVSKNIKK